MVVRELLDKIEFQNDTTFTSLPATAAAFVAGAAVVSDWMRRSIFWTTMRVRRRRHPRFTKRWFRASAEFQGRAPVIISSTPYGDANWFASMVRSAESGELEHARAYKATSASMNPSLTGQFLEAEERRDPDNYRGEYLAELVGSGGALLEPELVDNAIASRASWGRSLD